MAKQWNYKGIIPALALPLKPDYSIDEAGLRQSASWLATHKGISALMTNGHTGDVFSLKLKERAEVTRIVADELKGRLPVISPCTCTRRGRKRVIPARRSQTSPACRG